MKITFVLPKVSRYAVGGYKMVYEFANRLCKKGHFVNIIYINDDFMAKFNLPRLIRKQIAWIYSKYEPSWFPLDNNVVKVSSFENDIDHKLIDKTEVVIATAAQTVQVVENMFNCKKLYYIQGYENWEMSEKQLYETYRNTMHKIVVANWLKKVVDEYSPNESVVIKNPIDGSVYKIKRKYYDRNPYSIALLYNELPTKGFTYAFEALNKLKVIFPQLTVQMFGRKKYPDKLPKWITYTQNASQEKTVEIYNSSRVFINAPIEEGYGLTGLEAMACGCLLVSTRYNGVLEYANDETAVLVPIKDTMSLVKAVKLIFENEVLYNDIRHKAIEQVLHFSWDNAVMQLERLIEDK